MWCCFVALLVVVAVLVLVLLALLPEAEELLGVRRCLVAYSTEIRRLAGGGAECWAEELMDESLGDEASFGYSVEIRREVCPWMDELFEADEASLGYSAEMRRFAGGWEAVWPRLTRGRVGGGEGNEGVLAGDVVVGMCWPRSRLGDRGRRGAEDAVEIVLPGRLGASRGDVKLGW